MFVPASRAFIETASDLYLPASFEAPPPQVPVPDTPADWLHYGPVGDLPPPPFSEFLASPRFTAAQKQFFDRIHQCQQFARQHFGTAEAETINSGFDQFEGRLRDKNGHGYFALPQLQLLYGLGKQSFDSFCLLLEQPDIDPHQRKMALRELSGQVTACLSAGPAFTQALNALQQPEGTLRGEYWRISRALFTDALRRFVCEGAGGRPFEHLEDWEAHLVNRLRLELGLPDADPNDKYSLGPTLVTPEQVSACALMLQKDCRPATIATLMATEYRTRLLGRTSEVLGIPVTQIDPNQPLHMRSLTEAAQRLAPTFAGVSLRSLLDEDIDTGHLRLRPDDALLARELLLALSQQGLVQAPKRGTLLRGAGADSSWALRHLDQRIFFVQEFVSGVGGPGELSSVGPHHLRALPSATVDPEVQERALAAALSAAPPERLRHEVVASAVTSPANAELLLRRLGPKGSTLWAIRQRWDHRTAALFLCAATKAGNSAVVYQLLDQLRAVAPQELLQMAGVGVLKVAVSQQDMQIALLWLRRVERALSSLTPTFAAALLNEPSGVPPLLSLVAAHSDSEVLEAGLTLIERGRASGHFSHQQWLRQLRAGIERASASPKHLPALTLLGAALETAARNGTITPLELQQALEGKRAGSGCRVAVEANNVEGIRWFNDVVCRLTECGHLSSSQAGVMLAGLDVDGGSNAVVALAGGHVASFHAHLRNVTEAAAEGWISPEQLMALLPCYGHPAGKASRLSMILCDGNKSLSAVWASALLVLSAQGVLSQQQVYELLLAPPFRASSLNIENIESTPYLNAVRRFVLGTPASPERPQAAIGPWSDAVFRAAKANSINHEQLMSLLAGTWQGVPALCACLTDDAPQPAAILGMMDLYFRAKRTGLISDNEMVTLLESRAPLFRNASGIDVASLENVAYYVFYLLKGVEKGWISHDQCQQIFDGFEATTPTRTEYKTFLLNKLSETTAPQDPLQGAPVAAGDPPSTAEAPAP